MKRKQIYLPEQMIKKLEKIAQENGTRVSEVIRTAIFEYFRNNNK